MTHLGVTQRGSSQAAERESSLKFSTPPQRIGPKRGLTDSFDSRIRLVIQAESQGILGMTSQWSSLRQAIPNERLEIVPGVAFGRPEWVLSPAYWAALVQSAEVDDELFTKPHSLQAEVCFCLLGGYGITAEVNCAAYHRLDENGVFDAEQIPGAEAIERLLRTPLQLNARSVRYRFPRQRAIRISRALHHLAQTPPPLENSHELRNYLLRVDGIGPKTASWIARNWLGCDRVAILDIHVERAGRKIGLFGPHDRLPRDYFSMEKRFLEFAEALGVKASALDMAMWSTMRSLGRIAYS